MSGGEVGGAELVAAEHIDVVVPEWREALDVVVADVEAVAAQLGQGGVLVAGVPEHDGVEDESEGAELVFLSFAVALAELAALAVEHRAGQGVAALGAVELGEDAPRDSSQFCR